MGLFFNYDKVGPGVDKNAPKKKGIFLYFELLFRKFWILIKANLLYALVSLPVMFIYNIILINATSSISSELGAGGNFQISIILTIILTALWGTGPASCGYAYILRSYAREEHVWILSDFFEKIKENFKLGITVLIMDLVVLALGINSASVYIMMAKQGVEFARYGYAILICVLMVYTFMHFYVYELAVTFQNTTMKTIKNALVVGVATLPANLLLTVFVAFITSVALGMLSPFAIIILALIIWISLMRFPIDFYSARLIKRRFIRDEEDEESVE